jgi:hypothetical protein
LISFGSLGSSAKSPAAPPNVSFSSVLTQGTEEVAAGKLVNVVGSGRGRGFGRAGGAFSKVGTEVVFFWEAGSVGGGGEVTF